MNAIPITTVTFLYDTYSGFIKPQEFKGAFTSFVQKNCTKTLVKNKIPLDLIYNRDEQGKTLLRYPLVQLSVEDDLITLVGIGEGSKLLQIGVEALLLQNQIILNEIPIDLQLKTFQTQYWYPELSRQYQVYQLISWKPFDSQSLKNKAHKLNNDLLLSHLDKKNKERFNALEEIIWGNISRMLDELDVYFERKPDLYILNYQEKPTQEGYKIPWKTFDVQFISNVNLPSNIGIGHETSIGSGKIIRME